MLNKIPPWLPELEKWEQVNYDGIKGFPPEGIPQPHKEKFQNARFMLFHNVYEGKEDFQEIKSRFDRLIADKNFRHVLALQKNKKDYDEELFFLVDLFKATLLEESEGLRLLAGDDAVRGRKVLKGVQYAHEQKHGTKQEKEKRWKQYIVDCKKTIRANPRWGITAVRQHVAETHGVSLKTIERYTKGLMEQGGKI